MLENESNLYSAFKAKDARFDGRFVVGISSTKIYCRPVCKAKMPKAENCRFYLTPAQAEQAGYRPCLLCRPELAPGMAKVDAVANLARRTARILEENCADDKCLEEASKRLGHTDRHLRRAFMCEYNVSPIEYLQTCRLLLAKSLLTDTKLSVLDVAMAAGFGSVRRFNESIKKQYNLSPSDLRKQARENGGERGNLTLALGYRPPYDWEKVLSFFDGRAISGVEIVKNGEYMRVVRLPLAGGGKVHGVVRVGHRPEKNALAVTVSESLLPVLPKALARIRCLFDLYCDPQAVYETLSKMNGIRPGLCVLGTRVPGCFNIFEMAVRAILGQQISVKAASTLASRIVETYGIPVNTGIEGLTHIFPPPEDFVAMGQSIRDNLGKLGVTSARSNTVYGLAKAIVTKEIDFDSMQPEAEMKKLTAIKGIGSWTANYIAMRAMEWPDAFLETDVGVRNALGSCTPKEVLKTAEAWRPWRSYAVLNLWNSLYYS
jgi:AraC family transcriptional regulator of adaptative response / DNA-3-methyladenine glycosylase II